MAPRAPGRAPGRRPTMPPPAAPVPQPPAPTPPGSGPGGIGGGGSGAVAAPNNDIQFQPIAGSGGGLGNNVNQGAFFNYPGNLPDMFSRFAGSNLQSISDSATGGTINAYNTAANRLRERLDSSTRGQQQSELSKNLGRGFGNSGYNDMRRNQIASQGQYNYGQGLGDLSNMFETQRQQGLQTALGAANSDIGNRNQMDQMLYNLINNRENRGTQTNIANAGNASQANQNNSNNALQELLAQLQQLNNNYRSA